MENLDLRRLVDREQIAEILVEYCTALDAMDLPRLAALFTQDCIVDYGAHEQLRSEGAEHLAESLQRMWRWSRTSHHLTNVRIRFDDDDSAQVRSYVHAWHERENGSTATVYGQYHDRFVRSGAEWRIAERRMLMNGCDAGFTVDIHPFERCSPPPGWVAPKIDRLPGDGNG